MKKDIIFFIDAAKETYFMQLARTGYTKIPTFYSLSGASITMERIKGRRLDNWLLNNRTIQGYQNITKKVRIACWKMISVGIVHLDLSYFNILVDKRNDPWIVDFGEARLICSTEDKQKLYHDMTYHFEIAIYYNEDSITSGINYVLKAKYETTPISMDEMLEKIADILEERIYIN